MSKDDKNRSKKDNSAPKHKPDNIADSDHAPPGSVGLHVPSQGLGTSKTLYLEIQVSENQLNPGPELSKEEKRAEYLKSLPQSTVFAPITGDEDIDKQSSKNGEILVTKEEYESLKGAQKAEGPQISQSDYAKAFRRASGRTNEIYKGKSNEID